MSLGQKVLVWYDPADPQDVLVYGRDGRIADLGFVLAGTVFVLAGAAIAAIQPLTMRSPMGPRMSMGK